MPLLTTGVPPIRTTPLGSGSADPGASRPVSAPLGGGTATTTVSYWGVAVSIAVDPVAGAGATVHIRATALSGQAVVPSGDAPSGMVTHYTEGGATVELAEAYSTSPSPTALACLSQLIAVRAQLTALNARLQAARLQRAAAPPLAVAAPARSNGEQADLPARVVTLAGPGDQGPATGC